MSILAGAEERRSAQPLRLSVVVPTRNRSTHAGACARAILTLDGFTDLIFVDQSDDRATEEELSRIDDPRLRYVRTDTRGVTNGRNIGMSLSRGDIVAFTDDDCRVRPDWVQRTLDVFAADPEVAVVCGRVVVPDEVENSDTRRRSSRRNASGSIDILRSGGIGDSPRTFQSVCRRSTRSATSIRCWVRARRCARAANPISSSGRCARDTKS
jgi:Glycosyltransferases, probably involved in cell wall biogenesis